jgi:hypothetical protein
MSARALFAVLWLLSCGSEAISASTSSSGVGFFMSGTPSGTGTADAGGIVQDAGFTMSNSSVCGDGGVCAAGLCCGGICCTIGQLCCNNRCESVTINNPNCTF